MDRCRSVAKTGGPLGEKWLRPVPQPSFASGLMPVTPSNALPRVSSSGYSQHKQVLMTCFLNPSKKISPMPASLINAVVDSAVNAGVVPCGNQQPVQISHYPPPVSSPSVCAVVAPP